MIKTAKTTAPSRALQLYGSLYGLKPSDMKPRATAPRRANDGKNPSATKSGPGRYHKQGLTKKAKRQGVR